MLRPWVTRVWFARLFPLLPRWLAANVVTLLSTGTLTAIVLGSLLAKQLGPLWLGALQFVALQLYVAGDHLDGMQAKARGTTSPLGDFLDHHCDLWAGCVLCFGFWSLTGTGPLWELYALTIILISGFSITYVERAEHKELHFTAWGTLEVIAILSAFYLSWCIPAVRTWWLGDLVTGVPRHSLVAALGSGICIGATIVIARRLKRLPAPLLLFTATLIALSAWCVRAGVTPVWGWLAVALAAADYVALVMHAHTTTRPRPWPDFVTPAVVVALWASVFNARVSCALFTALTTWLVVRYVVTLTQILSGWRQHWTWVGGPAALAEAKGGHDVLHVRRDAGR